MKKDYDVLEELLDVIEQLGQRSGNDPGRGQPPSCGQVRKDLDQYRDDCEHNRLKDRVRRRRSGELLRRIVSIDPKIWKG